MKEISKQLGKDLSKIFFNSVEEMNECYGIDAELPRGLQNNADLVCYEIVEPFVYEYVTQYKFTKRGFYHLDGYGEPVDYNWNEITSELEVYEDDIDEHEERCFVYVRVNGYLRKHLEKTLLGCEFIHNKLTSETPFRRFVHSVEIRISGIVITDQDGLSGYLSEQLFYTDDYSDPIPYKEWVKEINEQDGMCEKARKVKKVII